jgi:DNA-binding NtrC family response regulator
MNSPVTSQAKVNQATAKLASILFVDDEPEVTEALKRALRREPYEFITATSAAAGQKILGERHVDVVVSDEQMPGMSGSEFLSWVRTHHPHAIRMILSGQATLQAAVRAINEGEVYRFFLKPCNPTDLMFTIQQAVTHKRLEEQSRRLLREFQRQQAVLAKLRNPGSELLHLETDAQGAILIDEDDGDANVMDLLTEIEVAIKSR